MISPSLIVFNVFLFSIRTTHLLYKVLSSSDLKHITSFWLLILFFIDLVFICMKSFIYKKYANANGKYRFSKHANAIDISITGSCGRGKFRRRRLICRGRSRRCKHIHRRRGRWPAPSVEEEVDSSMFFFQSKLLIYCIGFFHHQI